MMGADDANLRIKIAIFWQIDDITLGGVHVDLLRAVDPLYNSV